MRFLRQSTAVDVAVGPFLDETDGITTETGLTITQPDIRLKKNGGAWAQKSAAQTLSHEENGWYECNLSTTDTDTLGVLMLVIDETGALPVWHTFQVVTANVYDTLFSTDNLDVNVAAMAAGVVTAAAIATDAIDADAIAANAIGSSEIANDAITAAKIATGAIDADAIADNAIDAGAIASGAITSAKFAAGAITATVIATDAIDADALAADAIAEINATVDTALADYDGPTHAELIAEIDAVQVDIAGLNDLSAAQVNAEVVDALATDTYAEPGQGAPAATASIAAKIGYLFKAWRNRHTQTASEYALYADDTTTKDQEAVVSDDGTTFERGEVGTGA